MKLSRCSGILLHITSLPSAHGIGDLGPEARAFADFLARSDQSIWQILPLHPTGFGDSPYQSFSAFAGNPLLISLEELAGEGLLDDSDLSGAPSSSRIDYGAVIDFKGPRLEKAFHNFRRQATSAQLSRFRSFCSRQADWLDDFALFMAIKRAQGGGVWTDWEQVLARREPRALAQLGEELREEIECYRFQQFLFFGQWSRLHGYCRQHRIRIMGDMPLLVAHDSAEVWARQGLFKLDQEGKPRVQAGVPPDYFSRTGQLWGNPLYQWEQHRREGYDWWIRRFRQTLRLVDLVRLDHFRGFEACWEVPAEAATALEGEWVPGPGAELFEAAEQRLGRLPLVAENLGLITPRVEQLRTRFGFPGMTILQFAFGRPDGLLPHDYDRHLVAYTGTHDNDTALGWWNTDPEEEESTRTAEEIERERAHAREYLETNGADIHWAMVRSLMASPARVAILPLQDVLGLGSEARMNVPGRREGCWRWRFDKSMLTRELVDRLKRSTRSHGRLP